MGTGAAGPNPEHLNGVGLSHSKFLLKFINIVQPVEAGVQSKTPSSQKQGFTKLHVMSHEGYLLPMVVLAGYLSPSLLSTLSVFFYIGIPTCISLPFPLSLSQGGTEQEYFCYVPPSIDSLPFLTHPFLCSCNCMMWQGRLHIFVATMNVVTKNNISL